MWNFEVRDLARKTLLAPRVAAAGPLVSTIARPRLDIGDAPIIKADTPAHARELVKKQLLAKPDLIKIWFIVSPKFSPERGLEQTKAIMRAAVDQAHSAGVRVAVHATDAQAARASVEAGAEILVHSVDSGPMDAALVKLLKDRGVIVIPTLQVIEGYVETLEQKPQLSEMERKYGDPRVVRTWRELDEITGPPPPQARKRRQRLEASVPVMVENLARLRKAGVTIAAGTDAGNIGTLHGPSLHHELALMARAGMDPRSILLSATRDAARVFSAKPEMGTLEPGKLADLLVLDRDPLADIANLTSIHRVVKGGVVLTPGQVLPPNPEWVVQQQLDAYNKRDIEQFLSFYSADAELREHPGGKLIARGQAQLREVYTRLFSSSPGLRCRLLGRIVHGAHVVDPSS